MKHPPHPTFRFRDLISGARPDRLEALPGADEVTFFFNARSALFHAFRRLGQTGRRRVLLPAFHCVSLVEPALRAGLKVCYYRVDPRLRIDLDDVVTQSDTDVAAVLFINYFGFPAAFEAVLPELRHCGIVAIEDCSHSFLQTEPLSLTGGRADISVYSFWKLVPCAVGGGLRALGADALATGLRRSTVRQSIVRSKRLLEQAVLGLGDESALARLYAKAEAFRLRMSAGKVELLTRGDASKSSSMDEALEFDERESLTMLPALPKAILFGANLRRISRARRANYEAYAGELAGISNPSSVLPQLPAAVCPWAYPVLVPERSRHDLRLRSMGVPVWTFGDQLHPTLESATGREALDDARYLAANLLCLPVHQGISSEETRQFARIVRCCLA